MPDFQDGLIVSRTLGLAGLPLMAIAAADPVLTQAATAPPKRTASWSLPVEVDAGKSVGAAADPFAAQAARWERIARRVWSGRNDAEIPQWIRRDMSPNSFRNADPAEEAAMPLHYGIRPADLLVETAAIPMAGNVSLISSGSPAALLPGSSGAARFARLGAVSSGALKASPEIANCPGRAMPAGGSRSSAAVLQFPGGLEYVFPGGRMPPAYEEDDAVPLRATVRQTLAVFSLTGGTGRTSLCAGLARMLAGSGLRVLLADTSAYSLLPRLFGGGDSRQGVLRRFVPVNGGRNQMVTQVSLAVEAFAGDDVEQYRILHEFSRETASMDRIVWDLGGAPLDWAAKVLRISTQILVPLLPSAQSLVQLEATKCFLDRVQEGRSSMTWNYVLNGFNEKDESHIAIRSRLRQLLGKQLLDESLRSSPLVDEALALGKTVFDHAPNSVLAADFWKLGGRLGQVEANPVRLRRWHVRGSSHSAPQKTGCHGTGGQGPVKKD